MEWISEFLFPFLFILALIFGYYSYRSKASALMSLYQGQASKRNGTVQSAGFMSGPRLNLMDEGGIISIYEVAGSKNSPGHTYMKRELDLGRDVRIIVSREHVIAKIGKRIGMRDLQVGDPEFDDSFLIQGNDEFMIQSLLSPEIRGYMLWLMEKSPRIRIEKNVFEFAIEGHPKSDEEYDQFIKTGLAILGNAKMLGRGGETKIPAYNNATINGAIQVTPAIYAGSTKRESVDYPALVVIGLILVAVIVAGYLALQSLDKGDKKIL